MKTSELGAKNLRTLSNQELVQIKKVRRTFEFYYILENVYDTYNIGALFRLADAAGIKKVYLCGKMETPPNPKITSAAIGTERIVDWEHKETAHDAIEMVKSENPSVQILAVEKHDKACSYASFNYTLPLALIFGNESFGISQTTLSHTNGIVEIPMYGINKSLNVIVAAGIVSYWALAENGINIP